MKKIIVIAILLISSTAHAGIFDGTWDADNTKLHVPLTALMLIDLGQTLYIADNCAKSFYYGEYAQSETNYFLDECPSKESVITYFLAVVGLSTYITYKLDAPYSHAYQGSVITIELYAIDNNIAMGVGWKF